MLFYCIVRRKNPFELFIAPRRGPPGQIDIRRIVNKPSELSQLYKFIIIMPYLLGLKSVYKDL